MSTLIAQAGHQPEYLTENSRYAAGGLAARDGVLSVGGVANVDIMDINPTGLTMVTVQVTGNPLRLSAVPSLKHQPGKVFWEVGILTIVKPIAEFAKLIGANDTNTFIKVYNAGPFPAHYRIIFTNLEE
jgi:hypothetical protein